MPPTTFPLWPLLATSAVQTLATMAAYTLPALAPAVARDLGVEGALIGAFVSIVYGVGIVSSLLAPGYIHAFGAVRASQAVVLAAIGMLLVASVGTLAALAASAAVLGLAYGATAPSSTHLLVPLTPPRILNLVLSLRQIGVPLGGVLGALTMPPLALAIGWRHALLVQLVPLALLLVALELPRRRWDVVLARVAEPELRGNGRGDPRQPRSGMRLALACVAFTLVQLAYLAALLTTPWRDALPAQAVALAAMLLVLAAPGRRAAPPRGRPGNRLGPMLALLRDDPRIARLSIASFVYSGMQLCFVAFTTVHLTGTLGYDLIAAGQALATYQIAGAISRPVWGWLADRLVRAQSLLAVQGLCMAASAVAAGQFAPGWPVAAILTVCAVAGATASGYTGLAYAEYARLGGERRTEATGLGSAAMFAGIMLLPSLASLLVLQLGGYAVAYAAVGAMAGACGIMLAARR